MNSTKTITIEPEKQIPLECFSTNSWDFYYHQENMLSSKELEQIQTKLKVAHLPEIFYGYNRFYIVNKELNFFYEINPLQMINMTAFVERNEHLSKKGIYYLPSDVKVQYHNEWKDIKIDRDDIQTIQPKEDWTFCSPYMGSFTHLSSSPLSGLFPEVKANDSPIKVEETNMPLPVERLGQNNPIINYIETRLYEDELNDNGVSETKFRFRIMKDCFFGLLRSYLRVDNVIVRNIDTRIFYSFGENYILGNFQVKEITYEELNKIGFSVNSGWSLNPNQSDIISQHMGQPKFNISDKIFIK